MEHRPLWIVGAGLAGALLTCLLAKRGLKPVVSERRSSVELEQLASGRSINLALAERGRAALEMVGEIHTDFGPRNLLDEVMRMAIPMLGRQVHLADGGESFQPYAADGKKCIWSVHRARLNRLLLNAATHSGAAVHFDEKVRSIDLLQRRAWIERAGQSVEISFDVVLGADGAGSVLREAIDAATGSRSYFEALEHGYKELTIPPVRSSACDDLQFALAPHALHIWPRGSFMMIALPNPDYSFTATLFLQNEGAPSFSALQDTAARERFFGDNFASAKALMPAYVDELAENPLGKLATLHSPNWHYQDRALILGDAAHAIVPFHGQGMNCAFEDCAALADLVDQKGPLAWQSSFAEFVAARQPQAKAIAEMALENYVEMRDAVADPGYRLRKALEQELTRRHPKRFVSRYELVSFTRVPYATAQARGSANAELLTMMSTEIERPEQADYGFAARWIEERFLPL